MGRIGVRPDDAAEFMDQVAKLQVQVDGVFSHFTAADEADKEYTVQLSRSDGFGQRAKGLYERLAALGQRYGILGVRELTLICSTRLHSVWLLARPGYWAPNNASSNPGLQDPRSVSENCPSRNLNQLWPNLYCFFPTSTGDASGRLCRRLSTCVV